MANRDGRTTVIAPIEDTPADRAGIKPLDEIIKVDDKTVVGMESNEIVKMLRGEPESPSPCTFAARTRRSSSRSKSCAR